MTTPRTVETVLTSPPVVSDNLYMDDSAEATAARLGRATVIGCVHGAYRALADTLNPAPSYAWCEQQWTTGLAKAAKPIPSKALPAWLQDQLRTAWQAQQPPTPRPARGPKLTHHFTTSTGTPGLTRSVRRYVVVDPTTAKVHRATNDLEQARRTAAGTGLEVIDLRTHGRTAGRTAKPASPTPAPAVPARRPLLYLGTPSSQAIRDTMAAGGLGQLVTGASGNRIVPGTRWALDNGCFADTWTPEAWSATLDRLQPLAGECMFAVVPDVVGDAAATDILWRRWWSAPMRRGYRNAYVAQNGCRYIPAGAKAVFLGGNDQFKLGEEGRRVAELTKSLGLWLHMGRVNSLKRLRYAASIGCDSVDGTFLAYGPDRNLPDLMRWLPLATEAREVA